MQTIDSTILKDVISLKTTKGIEFINPAEILYFSIENRDVKIFHLDGNTGITLHSLKELETLLERFPFYRCHARYLINLAHVKRYTHKTALIELSNSYHLKVAFDRKNKFKQMIYSTLPPTPISIKAMTKILSSEIGFKIKNIGFRRYYIGVSAKNIGFSLFGVAGY